MPPTLELGRKLSKDATEMDSAATIKRKEPMIIDLGPGLDAKEGEDPESHDYIVVPSEIISASDHFQELLSGWLEEDGLVGAWAFVNQDGCFEIHPTGDAAEEAALKRGFDSREFVVGHIHVLSLD